MAICKHNTSKNGFASALEYLTMQHDKKGNLLLDGEGSPLPRTEYLIHGINCLPETFAPLCLEDQLRFCKGSNKKAVDTHQYILSFAPSDVDKGLTMEEAHRFGYAFAKKNFPGHRVLVCTHPDGGHHSNNIHVHIVISSLRFEDRIPDNTFMRLRPDGSVKPSEYRAGYAHQDTAALRKHLLSQLNNYCQLRGYVICPEKAQHKISQEEYLLKAKGVETRNDQLRRVISDAMQSSQNWDMFQHKLKTEYTYQVPVFPPIPYPIRKKLWAEYKTMTQSFWTWDNNMRASIKKELDESFYELKNCKKASEKDAIRHRIAHLKEKQVKERLYRQTFQLYTKAASLALRSHNQEDAIHCPEQMKDLDVMRVGHWQEGWNPASGSFCLQDGKIKSRITWRQITESSKTMAQRTLKSVQAEATKRKTYAAETREVPMPVEVKLYKGEVYFRHPESERWIRGKRLGDAYTMRNLGIILPHHSHQYSKFRETDYSR